MHGMHRVTLVEPILPYGHMPTSIPHPEPGPERQLARNGRSSLVWSRSYFEMAARACPGAAECWMGAARIYSGNAKCSTGAPWSTTEAQHARRKPARACSGATACSKNAARADSREVRSLLAFETADRRMLPLVRVSTASPCFIYG